MESFDDFCKKPRPRTVTCVPARYSACAWLCSASHGLGIADPRGADRKRLITYVEIDRCATDAIGMVTGCRLGKRTLKFRDWGKMAATFVDLAPSRAIRIVALENSRELAAQLYPHIETKNHQQMQAYRELSDEQLFREQWVRVEIDPSELPGYKGERIRVRALRRGREFRPFRRGEGERLCLSCAHPEFATGGLRIRETVPDSAQAGIPEPTRPIQSSPIEPSLSQTCLLRSVFVRFLPPAPQHPSINARPACGGTSHSNPDEGSVGFMVTSPAA